MNKTLVIGLCLAASFGCGPSEPTTTPGGGFTVGGDNDPVVRAAQELTLNLDTCAAGTTQGPRNLLADDFTTTAPNSSAWPMNAGYDLEFNADWLSDGLTARPVNPTWPGASPTAPQLPFVTGFAKFLSVCPLPGATLMVSALADTSKATDPTSDATLVFYIFDGSGSLLSVTASYALRAGNRKPLVLAGVPLPVTARRVAVVPMSRLGAAETQTVFYDDLKVNVEPSYTIIKEYFDDFSDVEKNQYGDEQPKGWGEWGGADFFVYNERWATVWNGAWGGNPKNKPPFEGGAFKQVKLGGDVLTGDLLTVSVLSANQFTDPTSYSMIRVTLNTGEVYESAKLNGAAWSNLDIRDVKMRAGGSFIAELLVGFGPSETSSLYFDTFDLKVRRPSTTLRAAKTYGPAVNYDGVMNLETEAMVSVPNRLDLDGTSYSTAATPWNLAAGATASKTSSVTYVAKDGTTVTCTYQGSSSTRYSLSSCSNGAVGGATVRASTVRLTVDGDATKPSTRVSVPFTWSYL